MERNNYTPRLKDTLVRLYIYIERFEGKDSREYVNFTAEGINRTSYNLLGSFVGMTLQQSL